MFFYFLFFSNSEFHATVVIHDALKIEHVLVEGMLRLQAATLLLIVLSLFCLLVIYVTLVIPARGCSMSGPLPETEPAKLMTTTTSLGTDHVVAALVLLYGAVALGALLGIRPNPTNVLRLRAILGVPGGDRFAICRPVCFFTTSPTRHEATCALYLERLYALIFASKNATCWIRTPLNIGVVVDI